MPLFGLGPVGGKGLGRSEPGDEPMRKLTLCALGALAVVCVALWVASGVAHACDPKTGEGCTMTSTSQPSSGGSTNDSTTTTTTKQPSNAGSTNEPGTTAITRPSPATPRIEPAPRFGEAGWFSQHRGEPARKRRLETDGHQLKHGGISGAAVLGACCLANDEEGARGSVHPSEQAV